ncbi:hypothetical protein L0U85_14285 [Glycomyces sp. L485]|uniref:hypothetical protein n=1 Tax=Glycomyces sp. L485 TaxID=2909235 RepID=UPI001F4B408B|nr:hypothetical protein [Glycomyces sp. L485]MCH7232015.1 hypothetical protein [Glycomyces sp. L485]
MVAVSLRQDPVGATDQNTLTAVRPTSGTPLWARDDHAPGAPRPASPWDEWTIPPRPEALTGASKPSPHPTEPFRPWRIDFEEPDTVEHPIEGPPKSATVAKRLLLFLGLAYLFLAALSTGLTWTGCLASSTDNEESEREPDSALPSPPRPPDRNPDSPGLHTRPDGTRYLVMPVPSGIGERLRGHAPAIGGGAA